MAEQVQPNVLFFLVCHSGAAYNGLGQLLRTDGHMYCCRSRFTLSVSPPTPLWMKGNSWAWFGSTHWLKQSRAEKQKLSLIDFAHCHNLLVECGEVVNVSIITHLCTSKQQFNVGSVLLYRVASECVVESHTSFSHSAFGGGRSRWRCVWLWNAGTLRICWKTQCPPTASCGPGQLTAGAWSRSKQQKQFRFRLGFGNKQTNKTFCPDKCGVFLHVFVFVWAHLRRTSRMSSGFIRDRDHGVSAGLSWFRKLSTSFPSLAHHDKKSHDI